MKILLAHNRYQSPGGEDEVFTRESELLRSKGHEVVEYVRCNDEIRDYHVWQKATLGFRTVWAWDSVQELSGILGKEKPDVVHFHNTFPLISPAAYYACRKAGAPVVQTLHNYRMYCPGALFLRNGRPCEECVSHNLFRSVRYGCYRDSRTTTASVAAALKFHRLAGTWTGKVDAYICLTEFQRQKLVVAGLPSDRVFVKPNFVARDPGSRTPTRGVQAAVFAGRLSPEKGLITLLRAWAKTSCFKPLRVIGDGPLLHQLECQRDQDAMTHVSFDGYQPHANVICALKSAPFMLFPSEWYETFGLTIVEAFACGVPVIASRLGVMEEIVEDGRTGLHFAAGDAEDLAAKVEWAWSHPQEMQEMGRNARVEYEMKYTAEKNYECLMQIYQGVLHTQN